MPPEAVFPISLAPRAGIDDATGLADRHGLLSVLGRRVRCPKDGERGAAIVALDFDNFHRVGDALGRGCADRLLRGIAGRLRAALRHGDMVARTGAAEFAVMPAGDVGADDAEALAIRLVAVLGRPYALDGRRVGVVPHAGAAIAGDDDADPERILHHAGLAARRAREEGRDFLPFQAGLQAMLRDRQTLESDLRHALRRGQLEMRYQPLLALRGSRISGFEALMRWNHPSRGLVSPAEFIPMAEELRLIGDIGAWAIREACREAARWPDPVSVSVNVSALQFEDGRLPATVGAALAESGLDGGRLQIEVTESALLRRAEATARSLGTIRAMDVRIAMDDFGTGFSSLTQLQSFPFDTLKIDRSFVARLGVGDGGADSTPIVRAIARMGTSLGMRMVAEGVETTAQLDALRREGCDEAQGFLFSRAVPVEEVDVLIARMGIAGRE